MPINPCQPSPCGPNSQCKQVNQQAVCSCLPGYNGSPPSCRPECVVSTECPIDKACINLKCVNPCPGTCGISTKCDVKMHSPICTCLPGYTGDPFTRCFFMPRKSRVKISIVSFTNNVFNSSSSSIANCFEPVHSIPVWT